MNSSIFDLSKIVLNANIVCFLACSFLFLRRWKNLNTLYKYTAFYLFFISIIQITFRLTFEYSVRNWVLLNIFLLGQILFIYKIYTIMLHKSLYKKVLKISVIIFLIVYISTFLLDYKLLFKINELLSFLVTLIFLTVSLLYWYENIGKKRQYVYILIAGLLYHFGSIFVFLFANAFLEKNIFAALVIYVFHTFLAVIYSFFVYLEWKVNIYNKSLQLIADKN